VTFGELGTELKGWQTGLGSMFGFVALMVAALWNFRLNRRRDAELRTDEALSVAAALYGEIRLLRKELGKTARIVSAIHMRALRGSDFPKFDKHSLEQCVISEPTLYKSLAPKIGLLSADLIIAITDFHADLQEAKTSLPLLVNDPARKVFYSSSFVLRPARDAIKNIKPTLKQIERMASFSSSVEEIDLGDTELVIDMEEESANEPTPP